jgi:TonB-dependent receptor
MIFCRGKNFFLIVWLILGTLLNSVQSYGQKLNTKGRVVGAVRNEKNELLVAATITVENSGIAVKTNVNGEYEVDLEPGSYTLMVTYTGLQGKRITEVQVKKSDITRLDVTLSERTEKEVVVTASAKRETVGSLYRMQKNNIAVSDGISIAQIARTPDNNVAQSLRRINGVTVVENKFVVVRGMGERYNNVTLNGSQLPSTEANKKNFSFDILPSSLIDNIVVNKTATPDLPADFAGGLVQVTTKEVPDKNTFYISAGSGYNTYSTGKEFKSTKLHDAEYAGHVEDRRRWYLRKWDPQEYFRVHATDLQRRNEINAQIPNTWGLHSYTALPIQDYQASAGLRKRFSNNSSFGVLVAGTYRNEQLAEEYMRRTPFLDSASGTNYIFNTNIGGLLSLAYNLGKSKLSFKNIYTRRLSHENYVFSGVTVDKNPMRNYASYINTAELLQHRLEGEHVFSKHNIRLKWFGDYAKTTREQPDNRSISYLQRNNSSGKEDNSPYEIDIDDKVRPSRGGIFASVLHEKRTGAGTDITIPFQWLKRSQKLKFGYSYNERNMDFVFSFMRMLRGENGTDKDVYGIPDYELFTEENARNGVIVYEPLTNRGGATSDAYDGTQKMHTGYAMLDFQLLEKLRFIGGVRAEDFKLNVNTVIKRDSAGNVVDDSVANVNSFKFYPSFNFIYSVNNLMNIRLALSKTTVRPDFRDVSPFNYYDFRLPGSISGNPFLLTTYVYNGDLRFEWYPGAEEVVTASIFYKYFTDPIETLAYPTSSSEYNYNILNQKSSTNIGVEMDFRKSFGFIAPHSKFLNNLFLSGNFSYMKSNVVVDPERLRDLLSKIGGAVAVDTSQKDERERPLQGLSPYTINAGLLYQGENVGVNVSYNRFGKRLIFAGPEAFLDVFENPRDVIDVQVYGKLLKKKLELKLNVSDILNNAFIQYNNSTSGGLFTKNEDPDGDKFNRQYDFSTYEAKRGTTISMSVSYKF